MHAQFAKYDHFRNYPRSLGTREQESPKTLMRGAGAVPNNDNKSCTPFVLFGRHNRTNGRSENLLNETGAGERNLTPLRHGLDRTGKQSPQIVVFSDHDERYSRVDLRQRQQKLEHFHLSISDRCGVG